VREDVADVLLRAGLLDVAGLAGHRSARLVKEGVHRLVFRVSVPTATPGETLELFVKVFRLPGLVDLARYVFRRPRGVRELRAVRKLEDAGVPTVSPVAVGWRRRAGILVEDCIVTETLEDVTPLDVFVRERLPVMHDRERARALHEGARTLASFVAHLHERGILHRDFHPGNILVRDAGGDAPELVLVDLHAVSPRRFFPPGRCIDNLVQLGVFFAVHVSRTDRLRFWRAYVACVPAFAGDARAWAGLLERRIRRACERLWRRRERRCLGDNREFRVVRRGDVVGHTVRGRMTLPEDALERIPARGMTQPDATVLKDSATTTIWKQRIDFGSATLAVIVKRKHRRGKGLLGRLRTFLRRVGPMHEWRMAYALRLRGLPAVEMLAVFERRRFGMLVDSVAVMREVEGAENLQDLARRRFAGDLSRDEARLRRTLAREAGRLVRRLHDAGFTQRDLKAANILVQAEATTGKVDLTLIDFEGMRRRRRASWEARVRDLARLARDFVDTDPVRTVDMFRFLDEYLAGRDVSPTGRRRLVAAIVERLERRRSP
jgi:tRNA A-37 threonylcarbamoyl transferase component Bud32